MRITNSACYGILVTSLIVVAGCSGGKKDKPKTVPVSGTVMYKGKPIEGVQVTFMAEGASRAATGITDSEGKFQLSTFGANDGAVVGVHTITVVKPTSGGAEVSEDDLEAQAKMYQEMQKKSKNEKSPIPEKYSNPQTSNLKETVTEDGPNEFVLQLTD